MSTTYAEQTWDYTYDALARLLSADKNAGAKLYEYTYDVAGNRLSETIDSGTPTNYTYNAANQLTGDGTNTYTYDANGNLIGDGTDTYTWDRANRLVDVGSHVYQYDGLGNRIQQTVSSTVTDYLLDLQPGLARVLVADDGSDTYRYVHSPRGIHAQELDTGPSQTWSHMLTDGLGSVRGTLNDALAVNDQTDYKPFGVQEDSLGTKFAFTGELLDANGLQHHRARYYNPAMGVWASLDPFEGMMDEPMTLNRYGYVSGNPINLTDHSGRNIDNFTGGISYSQMSAVGQLRTRQLQARANQQYARLGLLAARGGLMLWNWVRNLNNCGGSAANGGGGIPSMVNFTGSNFNSGVTRFGGAGNNNVFSICEQRCDHVYPYELWQQFLWGWDLFNSCVDRCVLGLNSQSQTNANCVTSHYRSSSNRRATQIAHAPSHYVLFTGSYPRRITQPGPAPHIQTPAWVTRINSIGGHIFQYTGSKRGQAQNALNTVSSGDIAVIGYSSGADTAVIFAHQYLMSGAGRVTDLVILGGTMSGTMPNGSDLGDSWMCILIDLLNSGTDVYALNDDGRDYIFGDDPEWPVFNSFVESNGGNTPGTYNYVLDSRPHYHAQPGVGTNDDPALVNSIFNWITSH